MTDDYDNVNNGGPYEVDEDGYPNFSECDVCSRRTLHDDVPEDWCGECGGCLAHCIHSPNVEITVAYKGKERTFALKGTELSEVTFDDGGVSRFFTTASKDFIADNVLERILNLLEETADL